MSIINNYHQGKELGGLKELYSSLLPISSYVGQVIQFLYEYAELLWKAYSDQNPLATIEISNYHKDYLGWNTEKIFEQKLNKHDIIYTVALEFGYKNIVDMERRATVNFKANFEKAVDALISGDKETLDAALLDPEVVKQTSSFGHNAALIHYLGSNGIEIIRQQVPFQIEDIIKLLDSYVIDWNQKMDVYGGKYNVLQLADTSIHPVHAGLNKKLHLALRLRLNK